MSLSLYPYSDRSLPSHAHHTQQFRLQLIPQSGRTLQPNQQKGITQEIVIHDVPRGRTGLVKMRWKASWKVMGNAKQEQGEVPALTIA